MMLVCHALQLFPGDSGDIHKSIRWFDVTKSNLWSCVASVDIWNGLASQPRSLSVPSMAGQKFWIRRYKCGLLHSMQCWLDLVSFWCDRNCFFLKILKRKTCVEKSTDPDETSHMHFKGSVILDTRCWGRGMHITAAVCSRFVHSVVLLS